MKLIGRKVDIVRCHIDPNIPGLGAKNAIELKKSHRDGPMVGTVCDVGIHVKVPLKAAGGGIYYQEHILPYANIQAYRLEPQSEILEKPDDMSDLVAEVYKRTEDPVYASPPVVQIRKMGRPAGSKNKPKE